MATTVNALAIRSRLGRVAWDPPVTFGPDGWMFTDRVRRATCIVTVADYPDYPDLGEWVHASIAFADRLPTYEDLTDLHEAVFPDGYAYQVFAPPSAHINIHPNALHLWGRVDGQIPTGMPNFGMLGTI